MHHTEGVIYQGYEERRTIYYQTMEHYLSKTLWNTMYHRHYGTLFITHTMVHFQNYATKKYSVQHLFGGGKHLVGIWNVQCACTWKGPLQ